MARWRAPHRIGPARPAPGRLLGLLLLATLVAGPGCRPQAGESGDPGPVPGATPPAGEPVADDQPMLPSEEPLTPEPAPTDLAGGPSPAAWFAGQLVGDWQALTVRYPDAGPPQSMRQTYSIARIDSETLVVEARTSAGAPTPVAAWVRYFDLPSTSGVAGIECRQGPLNELNSPTPSRISRGALIGRTLLLGTGAEERPLERRTTLLGEAWMLTIIRGEGEPPLLELARRGTTAGAPEVGDLHRIDSAAALGALLAGAWEGERFHSMTGARVAYQRQVSTLDDQAFLVRERLEATGGAATAASSRIRRLRLASRLDGRLELEETPWTTGEERAATGSTVYRGDLAGNVVTWTERAAAGDAPVRIESHWLLMGRDLIIRMTQEEDGSWWLALERRRDV